MFTIFGQKFDEERALYNLSDSAVIECDFSGPKDGESALKEARNIQVEKCNFLLRYPLWHVNKLFLANSTFSSTARAPLWYCYDINIIDCSFECVKALRECEKVSLRDCKISSEEFGWKCNEIDITNCDLDSVYVFFDSKNISLTKVHFKGKYSFQYVENVKITDSVLDTKDAFWHSDNVVVENSYLKGEYIGWYSKNLVFKNCIIEGTQPFCYSKNLTFINCTLKNADLSFEYSEIYGDIKVENVSIKNPKTGEIIISGEFELINENDIKNGTCNIVKKGD